MPGKGKPFAKGFDPRRNTEGRPPTGCATRELALELAEVMGAYKGRDGKEQIISRKRALLESAFEDAFSGDQSMKRFLIKELLANDHGFTKPPEGDAPVERLPPEIEEMVQGLKDEPKRNEEAVRADDRPSGKAGPGKVTVKKART